MLVASPGKGPGDASLSLSVYLQPEKASYMQTMNLRAHEHAHVRLTRLDSSLDPL